MTETISLYGFAGIFHSGFKGFKALKIPCQNFSLHLLIIAVLPIQTWANICHAACILMIQAGQNIRSLGGSEMQSLLNDDTVPHLAN